jgi:hypothetical protein
MRYKLILNIVDRLVICDFAADTVTSLRKVQEEISRGFWKQKCPSCNGQVTVVEDVGLSAINPMSIAFHL